MRSTRKVSGTGLCAISNDPPFPGQGAEEVEHQPADGIEFLRRQLQTQGLVEVRQGDGRLDPPDARGHFLQDLFLFLEFLGDFAAELLQEVFHRGQAHQGAVFIHHQGQTLVLGLEFVKRSKAFLFSGT